MAVASNPSAVGFSFKTMKWVGVTVPWLTLWGTRKKSLYLNLVTVWSTIVPGGGLAYSGWTEEKQTHHVTTKLQKFIVKTFLFLSYPWHSFIDSHNSGVDSFLHHNKGESRIVISRHKFRQSTRQSWLNITSRGQGRFTATANMFKNTFELFGLVLLGGL